MTYRFVPRRLRLAAQLATLLVTAIVGASVMLTPAKVDVKLSTIERTMSADTWGAILVFCGLLGFVFEAYTNIRKKEPMFWVVSVAHIGCCAVLAAYSLSALVGVLTHTPWNFGAPALGVLLSFYHYIYVQRRPKEPIHYVD